jgi:hypothetical protein
LRIASFLTLDLQTEARLLPEVEVEAFEELALILKM